MPGLIGCWDILLLAMMIPSTRQQQHNKMNGAPVKALLLVVTFSVSKNGKMRNRAASRSFVRYVVSFQTSNCKFTGRDENITI
jgi:hypothetical protein